MWHCYDQVYISRRSTCWLAGLVGDWTRCAEWLNLSCSIRSLIHRVLLLWNQSTTGRHYLQATLKDLMHRLMTTINLDRFLMFISPYFRTVPLVNRYLLLPTWRRSCDPSVCHSVNRILMNAKTDIDQTWQAWERSDSLEVVNFWWWSDLYVDSGSLFHFLHRCGIGIFGLVGICHTGNGRFAPYLAKRLMLTR